MNTAEKEKWTSPLVLALHFQPSCPQMSHVEKPHILKTARKCERKRARLSNFVEFSARTRSAQIRTF